MLVREKLKINYFYYKISGSNFLLDLPVYCRGNEAKNVSTRDLNNGIVDLTSRTGCEDFRENNRPLHNKRTVGVIEGLSHMAGNCSPVHMTSSLLLGSLSPYFSADDTIDGLLLPDVEEFVSCIHCKQDFCLSRQFKSGYLRIQAR